MMAELQKAVDENSALVNYLPHEHAYTSIDFGTVRPWYGARGEARHLVVIYIELARKRAHPARALA